MSRTEELLKQIEDAKRGMMPAMEIMLVEFGKAAGKAAVEFNKAFRKSTCWQHENKRRSEGIGGA